MSWDSYKHDARCESIGNAGLYLPFRERLEPEDQVEMEARSVSGCRLQNSCCGWDHYCSRDIRGVCTALGRNLLSWARIDPEGRSMALDVNIG